MAEIIPIIVSNIDELGQAIRLERTAILVENKDMYSALQDREKKSNQKHKLRKIGKGASAATGIASFIACIFGPVGIFMASAYVLTASLLTFGGSSLAGLGKSELDKYKIIMYEEMELLVLVKTKGTNAITKNDSIKLPK